MENLVDSEDISKCLQSLGRRARVDESSSSRKETALKAMEQGHLIDSEEVDALYPSLGFKVSAVETRTLGKIPIVGNFFVFQKSKFWHSMFNLRVGEPCLVYFPCFCLFES